MLLRNKVFTLFTGLCALFIPAAIILPRHYLFDMVNAFTIAVAFGGIYAFWPAVIDTWKRLRKSLPLENGHFLATGGVIILLAVSSRTLWLEAWRALGLSDEWLYHVFFAFLAWLVVPSAIFQMASPKILGGEVPRGGWAAIRLALISGTVMFAAFALWRWTHS